MVGAKIETHCLRIAVGMGSSSHCLVGDLRMSLVISVTSVGRKWSSDGGLRVGRGKCGDCVTGDMLARSLVTLSEKNVANCCAMHVTEERFGKEGVDERWRRLLTVFQSWRGFEMLDEMRLEW